MNPNTLISVAQVRKPAATVPIRALPTAEAPSDDRFHWILSAFLLLVVLALAGAFAYVRMHSLARPAGRQAAARASSARAVALSEKAARLIREAAAKASPAAAPDARMASRYADQALDRVRAGDHRKAAELQQIALDYLRRSAAIEKAAKAGR